MSEQIVRGVRFYLDCQIDHEVPLLEYSVLLILKR